MRLTLVILALLASAVVADATCVVRQRAVYYQRSYSYVQPVYAPVAVPVYVPAYTAVYGNLQETQQLLAEIQKLRQEVQQLRQGPAQQQAPQQQPPPNGQPQVMPQQQPPNGQAQQHPALAIFAAKCASCHDASVAKAKGGDFVLMRQGRLAQLNDRQALNISREVYSGRMPKGGKLTDEEVGQIMSWLDTHK